MEICHQRENTLDDTSSLTLEIKASAFAGRFTRAKTAASISRPDVCVWFPWHGAGGALQKARGQIVDDEDSCEITRNANC